MKRFSEQFKKKSETIRLRASERSDLCERLTSYMEYHPLPAELKTQKKATSRKKIEGIISEPFKAISINMLYVRSFAGVFAVFLVIGIPLVAERTVPGDILYPVKTQITEELRSSLKLSPYAKVEWETRLLERRVAEARLLASEGKLTPETEVVVAEAVKEHTDAVNQEIATMRETDEDVAAIAEIAFASVLSVQADVLEGYSENDDGTQGSTEVGHSVALLTDAVNVASGEADDAQADAAPSYDVLLGSVETETTRAYELFEVVKNTAGESDIADIERRLADVERKLVAAIVLKEAGDVPETLVVPEEITPLEETVESEVSTSTPSEPDEVIVDESVSSEVIAPDEPVEEVFVPAVLSKEERVAQSIELLRLALTDVQKLIIFMTDIEVRENITIEDLVPVTFTDEEKTNRVQMSLKEVASVQEEIETRIVQAEFLEKFELGTVFLTEAVDGATTYLSDGEFAAAQRRAEDALALAHDLLSFTLEQESVTDNGIEDVENSVDEEDTATSTDDISESEQSKKEVDASEDVEIVDEV